MAASAVHICNKALQLLGEAAISSFTDATKAGRACSLAYDDARREELAQYHWNFAKKRAELAADVATPLFDFAYQYQLPADFLRIHPDWEAYMSGEGVTWEIAGGKVLTDHAAPLPFIYTADIEATATFDPLFAGALAARIANDICDLMTESNTKKQLVAMEYQARVRTARQQNAFAVAPRQIPEGSWLTVRR